METAPVLTVEMVRDALSKLTVPEPPMPLLSPRGYRGVVMPEADALECLQVADDLRCDPCWLEGDGLHWAYLEGR